MVATDVASRGIGMIELPPSPSLAAPSLPLSSTTLPILPSPIARTCVI